MVRLGINLHGTSDCSWLGANTINDAVREVSPRKNVRRMVRDCSPIFLKRKCVFDLGAQLS
jgi:hypothetical protein